MTNEKLKELVAQENEELERIAAKKAKELIATIARSKQQISELQERISIAQQELRSLQVTQLDPASILGD